MQTRKGESWEADFVAKANPTDIRWAVWLYVLRSGALHPLSRLPIHQDLMACVNTLHEPRLLPGRICLEHLKEFMKYVKDNPNKVFAGDTPASPSLSHPCVMLSKKYQLEIYVLQRKR